MQTQKSFLGRFRKEKVKVIKATKKETDYLECPYSFGYLAHLPKSVQIPNQCMFCLKLINCRYNSNNK